MVDVEHDERARRGHPLGARELGLEPLLERAAVERAGQRVVGGEVAQLRDEAADALAQRQHDDGHHAGDQRDRHEHREPQPRLDPQREREPATQQGEQEVRGDLAAREDGRERPHPSHAHLEQTLAWIAELRPRRAVLTHMNHELDYWDLRRRLPAGVEPAYDGMVLEIGDPDHVSV